MPRARFALAKQQADAVLQRHGIAQRPSGGIPVKAIAETTCGATVVPQAFRGDGDLAGVLVREPGKRPLIGVNATDSDPRQRFTIAHELGHLLLHHDPYHVDRQIYLRGRDSSTAESVQEIEANAFASNLLMPAWMLKKDIDGVPDDAERAAEELAKMYGVSVPAMTFRLARFLKYGL